ncbi:MAG: dTMP kinase [Elainella sp.]
MNGKLVVFEGVEGSGKSTQIQQTQIWLQTSGLWDKLVQQGSFTQLLLSREPGGTSLGKAIRQLLLQPPVSPDPPPDSTSATPSELMQDRTELLLYAADRAQHVESFLKPQLASGALILCDRYTDSTIAYQGYGRGLDRMLIDQLNQIATGGLTSDLTFWLDLDVELGLARAQRRAAQDRIEQADLAFHQRVQQGFAQLAAAHPQRIVRIDASLPPLQVAQQIQHSLRQHLQNWFSPLNDPDPIPPPP